MRFGKDKSPYKTNVGIQFRHLAGKDVHAPGLYLHISLEECFIGAGMWRPDGPSLKAIREKIDAEQARFLSILQDPAFTAVFERQGEQLKRGPRDWPKDHPLLEELKRKDHIAVCPVDDEVLTRADLPDHLVDRLRLAAPFMRFLCEAIEQPF